METMYVSSLPFKADEETIRGLFVPFGAVARVELHADWVNPTHEPYALVDVEGGDAGAIAFALDGKKIGRTYLRVHRHAR